jgi:RHH-type transcriptional regulator, proline utilization regulon repressor / proline dehydrogenase / delta 1-pyrroline-5-carboxylate dehydrogenase
VRDVTGLASEQNVFRYAPVPVTVRVEDAPERHLVRAVAAGVRAGADVTVTTDRRPSAAVRAWLEGVGVRLHVEDASAWSRRAAGLAELGGRVRLVGGSAGDVAAVTGGSPAVAVYSGEVVTAGRVEMLTFLREQAVSITAHRFGTPRSYPVPAARGGRG